MFGINFSLAYVNLHSGIFEKVGIEPQIERIGKYKSAGDQLARKSISEENRDMLTTLLDNIYGNWLDKISAAKGALIVFGLPVIKSSFYRRPTSQKNSLQFLY